MGGRERKRGKGTMAGSEKECRGLPPVAMKMISEGKEGGNVVESKEQERTGTGTGIATV